MKRLLKWWNRDEPDVRHEPRNQAQTRPSMAVVVGNDVKASVMVYKERSELPEFTDLLTAPGAAYAVKESQRQLVAAVSKSKAAALLLAAEEFRSTNDYRSLHQRLVRGFLSVQEAIAPAPVLLSLYAGAGLSTHKVERKEGDEALSIKIFERIVENAIRQRATDIHIVILEDAQSAVILYRIDGIVHRKERMDQLHALQAVSVAYTKLAEKGSRSDPNFMATVDQSAMIPFEFGKEHYKLRYQSVEVSGGFRVVLRILQTNTSKDADALPLEVLGYAVDQCRMLSSAARKTVGLVVVTGPTGSGKSTTIKTLLTSSPTRYQRIQYSIEKPAEYKIFGVGQKSIQQNVAENDSTPMIAAMRSLLRADPDELMVGEVTDREMTSLLKGFVQSGHPAMTTVHAASAIDIVARLTSDELGIPRHVLASRNFLTALVFQRLIPKLCTHCRIPASEATEAQFPAATRELLRTKFEVDPHSMFVANLEGCEHCKNTGTRGLTVVAEVIRPDHQMRNFFRDSKDDDAEMYWRMMRTARFDEPDCAGKTALEHGIYKATQGIICPIMLEAATEPYEDYQVFPMKGEQ